MNVEISSVALWKSLSVLVVLVFLSYVPAQGAEEVSLSSDRIENLISCIKTGNTGCKKCAIYFAGKYKVEEAADALNEVMEQEKDYGVIMLAVFALYQIDEHKAVFSTLELAINTDDESLSDMLLRTAISFARK